MMNKMKSILFVIDSIACGGAERGLIALLNKLDYERYNVDLLYFCHENEYFKEQIPKEVNIIMPDEATSLALSSKSYVMKHITHIKYWQIIIRRLWFGLIGKINNKSYFKRRVKDWNKMKKYVPIQEKEYDAAIGFIENSPTYYSIDNVIARRHILFQRTDYKTTGCCPQWDLPYYEKADKICVLSEEMRQNFVKEFPQVEEKVIVFPNIIDVKEIVDKSKGEADFNDEFTGIKIISVGTLRKVKGYDVAMKACRRLIDMGYDFKWYILGSGEERQLLENQIKSLKIEDRFILLGSKRNPYAYISKSDIFVQCSYREGFSTSVFEAKCLQMPIVITDAPGMRSQIENNVNGLIAQVGNEESVTNEIKKLLDSKELRKSFSKALETHLEECADDTAYKLQLFDKITG